MKTMSVRLVTIATLRKKCYGIVSRLASHSSSNSNTDAVLEIEHEPFVKHVSSKTQASENTKEDKQQINKRVNQKLSEISSKTVPYDEIQQSGRNSLILDPYKQYLGLPQISKGRRPKSYEWNEPVEQRAERWDEWSDSDHRVEKSNKKSSNSSSFEWWINNFNDYPPIEELENWPSEGKPKKKKKEVVSSKNKAVENWEDDSHSPSEKKQRSRSDNLQSTVLNDRKKYIEMSKEKLKQFVDTETNDNNLHQENEQSFDHEESTDKYSAGYRTDDMNPIKLHEELLEITYLMSFNPDDMPPEKVLQYKRWYERELSRQYRVTGKTNNVEVPQSNTGEQFPSIDDQRPSGRLRRYRRKISRFQESPEDVSAAKDYIEIETYDIESPEQRTVSSELVNQVLSLPRSGKTPAGSDITEHSDTGPSLKDSV